MYIYIYIFIVEYSLFSSIMTSRVLYLSHKDSISIHEGNKPDDFIVEFNDSIEFNTKSSVELLELKFKISQKSNAIVYVFCDICDYSIINGKKDSALRSIIK